MTENENEFEGIELMSPEETNALFTDDSPKEESTSGEATSDETIENDDNTSTEEDDDFGIASPEEVKAAHSKETPATDEEEEDDDSEKSEENVSLNKYATFIKELISEEVLTVEDEEELEELLKNADRDTLMKFMENTVEGKFKENQENWKKSLSPEKRKFLEIEANFDKTDTAIQMAQRLNFFETLTDDALETDVNLQKNLYFDLLRTRGFSEEEAKEKVLDAEQLGKLNIEAAKAVPKLKDHALGIVEEAKNIKDSQREQQQKANEERFNKLMGAIDEKESFVSGLNLNKVSRDKLKKNITEPVYQDKNGKSYTSLMYKQMKNPAGFEMLINYFDTIGMFDIDKDGNFSPNITKLKNIAKTKAVTELDSVLAKENAKDMGRVSQNRRAGESTSTKDLVDFLEKARKNR